MQLKKKRKQNPETVSIKKLNMSHFISSSRSVEIYHLYLAYEDPSGSFSIEKYLFTCLSIWTFLEIKSSDKKNEHNEFSLYLVKVC